MLYLIENPFYVFALQYYYKGGLRRYVLGRDALQRVGSHAGDSSARLGDLVADALLVAQGQQLSAEAVQSLVERPGTHTTAYRALHEFPARRTDLAARWTLLSHHEYLAQFALAFALLKRRASES